MKRQHVFHYFLTGLAVASLSLSGCGKAPQKAAPKAPKVTVAPPEEKPVLEYEDLPGRVEAIETVEVKARVTGLINKIHFKEGTEVKQGDPLYSIDPREYQAEVDSAAAALQQAQARFQQSRSDFERAQQLSKQTAISRQELETKGSDMMGAEAGVRLAQANLEKAKLNLEYTQITAPISGKIGETAVTDGNLVKDGDTLTSIISQDPIYVTFEVPERLILRWDKAVKEAAGDGFAAKALVSVGLLNETGFPREGRLDFTDNELNVGTGTLRMRAVLPNEDRRLRVGLYARVRVSLDKARNGLLVPERAVGMDQGQRFIYVVGEGNKAEYRRVQVGQLYEGQRAITDGLKSGERVVVEGHLSLRPGIVVEPTEASAQ